jgi:hypothetical protein
MHLRVAAVEAMVGGRCAECGIEAAIRALGDLAGVGPIGVAPQPESA